MPGLSTKARSRSLAFRPVPPRTPEQLRGFIRMALGVLIPVHSASRSGTSPLEYLSHAFFEHLPGPRDCVVWANRGGGKTYLGAVATFLDMLFKPGVQVRILGGSLDQSARMLEYLSAMFESQRWNALVQRPARGRSITLRNGSRVTILSQSQRAVRGQRVHKLRCDEVELFDEDIWEAAQLVTRSGWCGNVFVRGSIEALSTMHRPFGLMHRLADEAQAGARALFRWNAMDVLETCPPARACDSCALHDACEGRAKQADGFVSIDDVLAQRTRTSDQTWQSELLCERPNARDLVYPEFDPAVHVRAFDAAAFTPAAGEWIGGLDFGYRAPTALLWAWHDCLHDCIYVVDEQIEAERTMQWHIDRAEQRTWPCPAWIGADPAGHQRNDQTGRSAIHVWRRAGWTMRTRASSIESGIELVRSRLRSASGEVRLLVHPRCAQLVQAMMSYHFDADRAEHPQPVKDGPDHVCDALRYMLVNLDQHTGGVTVKRY